MAYVGDGLAGAMIDQTLDGSRMTPKRRQMERRVSVLVGSMYVGVSVKQELDASIVAIH